MLTLLLILQLTTTVVAPPAVLNMPRLVAETVDGKAASAKLEALRNERRKTLDDKRARCKP